MVSFYCVACAHRTETHDPWHVLCLNHHNGDNKFRFTMNGFNVEILISKSVASRDSRLLRVAGSPIIAPLTWRTLVSMFSGMCAAQMQIPINRLLLVDLGLSLKELTILNIIGPFKSSGLALHQPTTQTHG